MFLENTFIFYFMIVKGMFSSVERESILKNCSCLELRFSFYSVLQLYGPSFLSVQVWTERILNGPDW